MLKGKVVIVTGSTSGIGLEILREFAQEGSHVVMNGFGEPGKVEKIRLEIEKTCVVKALYHGADMTKPDEIKDLVETAHKKLGSVDVIVNNAGIQFVSPIAEFPEEKWDAILAINLSSAFHMIRAALPLMEAQGWGRIINIASAHALVASPFKAAYVAAKHGLGGLTKVVALEAAEKGVTCNAICPGYVKTPLVENQIKDTAKARGISEKAVIRDVMLGEQPTKEFVKVREIAGLTKFLCGDEGASITGVLLPIDGGWTAH